MSPLLLCPTFSDAPRACNSPPTIASSSPSTLNRFETCEVGTLVVLLGRIAVLRT